MKVTSKDQLKIALQKAKQYTGEHVVAITDALEELDNDKASKPLAVSVTIPTTGWQEDSNEDAAYPQYYDIAVEGVTADDIPTVCIAPASLAAASACGMCQTCETVAGAIRLRAASAPTSAIQAEYRVEQGRGE